MIKHRALWEKISNFSLDNPEASFSFTDRLARENGWSLEFSKRVIDEYKKFVYLSIMSGKSLTPSDEVDQAWHLHLIYSYSYWVEFSEKTLNGFKMHHGPTKGGKAESEKYNNQYEYTLQVYKEVFHTNPPSDIWPSSKIRFAPDVYKRVNTSKNFVLNKDKVTSYMLYSLITLIGLLFVVPLMAGKGKTNEPVNIGTVFLWILGIAVGIFIIRGIFRYINRKDRKSSNSSSSSSSSGCDSGCSIMGSFFGCGSDGHGCSSSGCSSSGCSSCGGGCGGCGD